MKDNRDHLVQSAETMTNLAQVVCLPIIRWNERQKELCHEKQRCITCRFVYGLLHIDLDMAGDVTHKIRLCRSKCCSLSNSVYCVLLFLEHRKMLNYRKNALIRNI